MTDEGRTTGGSGQQSEDDSPADRALAAAIRAHASRPHAPAALRARVEAALALEVARLRTEAAAARPGPRAPGRWAVASPALAAALAGLVVAGVTAATVRSLPETTRRLAADTVRAAHVEYERLEAQGPTAPADDATTLSQRLSDALDVPVRIAEPDGGAVRTRGTAPAALFGKDGIAVFFDAGGERLMLTLVPSPATLPPENRVRLGRGRPFVAAAGGTRFVLWRQGPLFCALAGDLSEARLTALFRRLRPGIEVGS